MKLSSHPFGILGRNLAMVAGITFATQAVQTEAAVTAGGLAIIGFTDNRTDGDPLEDTFTMVALEAIEAGTQVYFTDNGWIQAENRFRGANTNAQTGDESLLKLTFTSSVAAGTIMRSGNDDFSGRFAWDTSSSIAGGNFSLLNLSSNASTGSPIGDQIYIFQAPDPALPLTSVSNAIYLLDLGDQENPGFEEALTSSQGHIHPDLSLVPNTAWILPDIDEGDDGGDFHNGSFALYLDDPDVSYLQTNGGTKAQWLAVIADYENWWKRDVFPDSLDSEERNPDLEDDLMQFGADPLNPYGGLNVLGIPEPSRALLIGLAFVGAVLRRRRE